MLCSSVFSTTKSYEALGFTAQVAIRRQNPVEFYQEPITVTISNLITLKKEELVPRPIRVEYPGACYHVINRGNRRNTVFLTNSDCWLFLEKLADFALAYDVTIHSYCLMPNHYHLFLETKLANLSKFMQSFTTSFTLKMNIKYNKSGHLFQGRYKAQLVESDLYRNELSRYIHLNPVKIKSLENASLEELKQRLRSYKWSSYPYYMGVAKKPDWVNLTQVLSSWGKTKEEKIRNYRKYIDKGLLSDNSEKLYADKLCNIIGSESFVDRIKRKYLTFSANKIDPRDQPNLAKVNAFTIDQIIHAVALYFSTKAGRIIIRMGSDKHARRIAMFLSVKHCKKLHSLREIGLKFAVGVSAVSSNSTRTKEKILNNKSIKKQIENIEKDLYEILESVKKKV